MFYLFVMCVSPLTQKQYKTLVLFNSVLCQNQALRYFDNLFKCKFPLEKDMYYTVYFHKG